MLVLWGILMVLLISVSLLIFLDVSAEDCEDTVLHSTGDFYVTRIEDFYPEDPAYTPLYFENNGVVVRTSGPMVSYVNGAVKFTVRVNNVTCVAGDRSFAYVGDSFGNVFTYRFDGKMTFVTRGYGMDAVIRIVPDNGSIWVQRGMSVYLNEKLVMSAESGTVQLRMGPSIAVDDLMYFVDTIVSTID